MILTEKFIENVLNQVNCSLIYVDEKESRDKINSFANSLVGLEHLIALTMLSKRMYEAQKQSNAERNVYVPLYRVLSASIDYGFSVGETVRYKFSSHTERVGKILKIQGSQAHFREVILPLTLVSKYFEEPFQLSLF